MVKPQYKDIYDNPTWLMYECDNGARWTAVKGGTCAQSDNDDCCFSGCPKGHKIHIKSETNDRIIASDWFRRP